ncbi:MAG: PEGA domain-containing protein [Ignavibacteriae bacterium]|nr:PEGA domain-containing protein [Ignavibacteria bacterium]MBI3364392.1 PEGA domain-containing protein [Ignavibacteriota bacterium]
MRQSVRILVLMVVLSAISLAGRSEPDSTMMNGDSSAQSEHATLSVRSEIDGVSVYVDSELVGITPLDRCPIMEGTHILRFIHPEAQRWLNAAVVETLLVHPAEQISRTAAFPEFFYITSQPFGATVRADGRVLGETPLYLPSSGAPSFVMLSKDGFREATVPVTGSLNISLQPLDGTALAGLGSVFLSTNQTKSSLPIYLTSAATVIAGAAAAYFKIKADNAYSDYRQNGDQSSLDRIHHNDAISGVALVACEVNILALTFFLFSR